MKLHFSGAPLFDDDFVIPADKGTGYQRRSYVDFPLNGQSYNQAAPKIKRLSEQEILEIAIEKIAKKTFLIDHVERIGLPPKDQSQSNFCHIHGPVGLMEALIAFATGAKKILSAFFPGSQITGGRNVGGSGVHDIKWLVENGTCDEDIWKPMKFHGSAAEVAAAKAESVNHKPITVEEFEPGDLVGMFSVLCQDQGLSIGTAWDGGGHEVWLGGLVFKTNKPKPSFGDLRPKFRNSWGNWGDKGCGVLDGSKFTGIDEVMRIAEVTMSAK